MGNEQPTSYEVPANIESLSPDEAAGTLRKIYADAVGDSQHPHNVSGHFQHKDFMTAVTRLHEIKCPEPEPQTNEEGEVLHNQFPQPIIKVMGEGLALKENKDEEIQASRIEHAEVEMDKLVKAGYERDSIPDDISARQVDVLTMQRMSAEDDYDNLKPLMSKNLRDLQAPQGVQNMFEVLNNSTELDSTLRQQTAENIIGWINRARKFKEGI